MASMKLVLLTAFLSWTQRGTLAKPSGAPREACTSMYPMHQGPVSPVSAQQGLVQPFQILFNRDPNDATRYKIRVVRNTNFPGAPPLLGFFLQVREANEANTMALGQFVDIPSSYARSGECGPVPSTVTHINALPKDVDRGLEFTWVPTELPANIENIQVLGTFVQNVQTFWVKTPSQPVRLERSAQNEGPSNTAGSPPANFNNNNAAVPTMQGDQSVNLGHNNNDRNVGSPAVPNHPPGTIKVAGGGSGASSVGVFGALIALFLALVMTATL